MQLKQKIYNLYTTFYAQKSILTEAPALTIDINTVLIDNFDTERAKIELAALVSYMLGLDSVKDTPVLEVISLIKTHYANQEFWRHLLLEYVEILNLKHRRHLKTQTHELRAQMHNLLADIIEKERQHAAVIEQFAAAIDSQHFAIDSKKMLTAYFYMRKQDAIKAWQILITNPAYFSPIITKTTSGKTILDAKQAITENKKIARFVKQLKL